MLSKDGVENEVFSQFAGGNGLLAHTCIAHTEGRTSASFAKSCLRARVIWPSSDRLQRSRTLPSRPAVPTGCVRWLYW